MKNQDIYKKIVELKIIMILLAAEVVGIIAYWKRTSGFSGGEFLMGLGLVLVLALPLIRRQVRNIRQSIEALCQHHDRTLRVEKLAAVSHLAAGTADKIRNPLTTIKGFAFLLQNQTKESERCWGYTNIILREVAKIERIINNFLLLSKPGYPVITAVNINKLIDELLPLLVNRAVKNKVKIITVYDDKIPIIQADQMQIRQVIINLAGNSLDAMPNGGCLSIETRNTNGICAINITDTGAGIPADHVEKIGEPFYTTKDDGIGLGLTVSHRIIINHEGSLEIETGEGQGTTFRIKLPVMQEGAPKKELA